jgi:5'-AMP-activated protein kinase regulatory beta subunit
MQGFKRVVFTVNAEPGSDVYVSGTFNNWHLSNKRLTDKHGTGKFALAVMLPPGEYQYKFINGVWCVDPNCQDWVANDVGSLNSVLRVE